MVSRSSPFDLWKISCVWNMNLINITILCSPTLASAGARVEMGAKFQCLTYGREIFHVVRLFLPNWAFTTLWKKKNIALLAAFALPLEAFFAFFQLHLECRPFLFSLPYYDQVIPWERDKMNEVLVMFSDFKKIFQVIRTYAFSGRRGKVK